MPLRFQGHARPRVKNIEVRSFTSLSLSHLIEPTSNTDGTGSTALRGPKVVSEDSEDDIQMTTR